MGLSGSSVMRSEMVSIGFIRASIVPLGSELSTGYDMAGLTSSNVKIPFRTNA